MGQRGADNEDHVLACIVPRQPLGVGEVIAHCRTHLTPHKVPRQIFIVAALPKNTAGKIDKMALAKSLDHETHAETGSIQ